MKKEYYATHVKIGDKVKVISGDQKGFVGTILRVEKTRSVVAIDGIPYRTKVRKTPQKKETETVELATWIHLSNVMLWDIQTTQASRIGYKTMEGKKKRYFRKSGNILQ